MTVSTLLVPSPPSSLLNLRLQSGPSFTSPAPTESGNARSATRSNPWPSGTGPLMKQPARTSGSSSVPSINVGRHHSQLFPKVFGTDLLTALTACQQKEGIERPSVLVAISQSLPMY
ncbi:hypothetical protein D9611_013380 [Ephemerocybe angulata]|uniref:Uncharacterized protein n=1 Tax=Ephemerocybe angulata TaxID=980116 RepID=A0A8H5CBE8_9AGAR|nr:hypothetical protein D9611_013380 [Tulosesus angulatus]